jgi:hypothetical protein
MYSLKVALINQTDGDAVPPDELEKYRLALQHQVDNDFAPVWKVRADISAPNAGARVPRGTSRLNIVNSLTGRAGVHTNDQGHPSAEVVNDDQLSITLSHELLEMLVDPSGTRFIRAPDLDPYSDSQQVHYLVEVCDPCAVYSYEIDGVEVSDFVLPSFYDPYATGKVDHAGLMDRPLWVPLGGYISWLDPVDYRWHEQQPNRTFLVGAKPGASRDDRNAALGHANPHRHNVPEIYRAWPKEVLPPR